MKTTDMEIARERQLDWLLCEALGAAPAARTMHAVATTTRQRWLAAAIVTLAVGAAFGVAVLQRHERDEPAQVAADRDAANGPNAEPIEWIVCYGPDALEVVPRDVVNLKALGFDDDTLSRLGRFGKLERLDLSGTLVDSRGVAMEPMISDVGVADLKNVPSLRWLSLASCRDVEGTTLRELEVLPRLEHLDLGFTAVTSAAIERLPRLPSLRSLSLAHCLEFHGRSLAAVAKIPGLRRLELAGCATLSADDVAQLRTLHELRVLDLRDCMGSFRGQTAMLDDFGAGGEPTPTPPRQDGIGVTDAAVHALRELPLTTLQLGGCTALTDAIGTTLRAMTRLRHLDIGDLPGTTTALLRQLPGELIALRLDGNRHYDGAGLRELTRLTALEELGLDGVAELTDDGLAAIVADKPLRRLALGGAQRMGGEIGSAATYRPQLTGAAGDVVARIASLTVLELPFSDWLDRTAATAIARLPELRAVVLRSSPVTAETLRALADSRSLRSVDLAGCRELDLDGVRALTAAQLTELDTRGTGLDVNAVRELAAAWPGCRVRLPNGAKFDVP